jgi:hypothetical protein
MWMAMWCTPGAAPMTFGPQVSGTCWPLMTAVGRMKAPNVGCLVTMVSDDDGCA